MAKSVVDLPDKLQNMGAKLLLQVASNTNEEAGDGTTTATVLAREIASKGLKAISDMRVNPYEVRQGMQKAVDAAVTHLKSIARQVGSHEEVAQVSSFFFFQNDSKKS